MIVEMSSLTKSYGQVNALADCSIAVAPGDVLGLLGPNGAGKTTLLRLLLGYLRPTAGWARIAGLDCYRQSLAVRRQVAYLPAEAAIFPHMRTRDALRFFADTRPGGSYERSLAMAERLELDLSRKVSYMSTGMKQKLALAATVASDTPLLILDEPTANLDPTVRSTVLSLVAEAKAAGRTVLFSSHVLPEVEEVCDRVVILRAGRVVHEQPMSELKQQHRIISRVRGDVCEVPESLTGQVRLVSQRGGEAVYESPSELAPILKWLASLPLEDIRIEPLGLRSIYDRFHSENGPASDKRELAGAVP